MSIAGFIGPLSYKLFDWIFKLEPAYIWKWTPAVPISSFSGGWIIFILIADIILATFFAFLYAVLYNSIPGQGIKKGLVFGLLMWPLGVVIPLISMYMLINIASGAVVYFLLEGLFEWLLYGAIISLIYK